MKPLRVTSPTGWQVHVLRLGYTRTLMQITAFSVIASVIITMTLSLLTGIPRAMLPMSLLISVIVPSLVAPMASHSIVKLILELDSTRTELRYLATHDGLTGTLNRCSFLEILEREFTQSQLEGKPLSVLMIDADCFKAINDQHGHAFGDHVLQQIVLACTRVLRSNDTLGRYGGEEFAVLLPGATLPQAIDVAERVRGAVARVSLQGNHGREVGATVSIGVSTKELADSSGVVLLARADVALYRAKRAGRNRWVAWDHATETHDGSAQHDLYRG